jgi:hypothetical protein
VVLTSSNIMNSTTTTLEELEVLEAQHDDIIISLSSMNSTYTQLRRRRKIPPVRRQGRQNPQ